jgi:hypothetical protein
MIQNFCGKEQQCALTSIEWDTTQKFVNGCRSPPWRQIYGELGYIQVKTVDKGKLILVTSKRGHFVCKGYEVDQSGIFFSYLKGNEKMNYEKVGDLYPTLVQLLSVYSPHFAERINNQEYAYIPKKSDVSFSLSTKSIDDNNVEFC